MLKITKTTSSPLTICHSKINNLKKTQYLNPSNLKSNKILCNKF